MRLIAPVLGLTAAIALLAPAPARADADPASDVLLIQRVFYPYQPAVPQTLQNALNAEVAAAARAHFPIKVALIATRTDLGAIPELFGHPQRYAAFLDQEISFGTPQPLLVVMPNGYGVRGLTRPAAAAVVPALDKPPDEAHLAQAAIVAVRRLAAADGHPLPASAGAPAGAGGDSGNRTLIIVVVALAAVGISAAILAFRNRPRR